MRRHGTHIFTLLPTQHQFLFMVHTACRIVFSRANNFRFGRPLLCCPFKTDFLPTPPAGTEDSTVLERDNTDQPIIRRRAAG